MNKLAFAFALTLSLAPALAHAGGTPDGSPCMTNWDCAQYCVNYVCCSSQCAGQCEACDVPGSLGVCTPVVGTPRGLKSGCFDGAGKMCAFKACDGTNRFECKAFRYGPTDICVSPKCENGMATLASHCDGAGACGAVTAVPCSPYACGATACKTTCASSADCASGFSCAGGKCVPIAPRCSADGSSSIAFDGVARSCAPYRCGSSGDCQVSCASNNDCSSPHVCDTTTMVCEDPNDAGLTDAGLAAPSPSTSGGCTLSGRGGVSCGGLDASAAALAFGALLGLGLVRDRRARSSRNG